MKKVISVAVISVLAASAAHAQSGATSTASCADHLNTSADPDVGALLNCLVEMQRSIDRLTALASAPGPKGERGLKGDKGDSGEKGEAGDPAMLPVGIVAASTKPCGELGSGWSVYSEASGRFILGVGQGPLPRTVAIGNTGGSPEASISLSNLPREYLFARDDVPWASMDNASWHNNAGSTPAQTTGYQHKKEGWNKGGGTKINKMPPYVALYFCKKEG